MMAMPVGIKGPDCNSHFKLWLGSKHCGSALSCDLGIAKATCWLLGWQPGSILPNLARKEEALGIVHPEQFVDKIGLVD